MAVLEEVRTEPKPKRKSRLATVLLVIAVFWLAFAVLQELLTGRVWFWVLPGLMPPILFVIVPVLLSIAGALLKRFRLVVPAIAVLSFLLTIPSSGVNYRALLPRGETAAGDRIRVVQMNTDYWGQLREGTLSDPRDKESMLQFLRRQDADVYLLQEHMTRVGDQAPPVTDLSDVARVFPEYQAVTAGTLITLSRLPVVDHKIVNTETGSDLALPPPPYELRVDVRVGAKTLSTYNIHMPIQIIIEQNWFDGDFYREIERRHEVRQNEFRVLTKDVTANTNPVIVAGDFNTSPAMGDNRELLDVTEDGADSGDRLYPSTWRVGGQLPMLWRNDWYLIRNDIEVEEFRSIDPEGNSDHLVQSVDLVVTE